MKKEISERFAIILGEEQAEFVRNYRYTKISKCGDIDFTIRDVFVAAVDALMKTTTMEIIQRPDYVKKNEAIKKKKKAQAIIAGKQAAARRLIAPKK